MTYGELTYSQWYAKVDKCVQDMIGLSVRDLPDWMSRDMYDAGEAPQDAAEYALEEAGYYEFDELGL
jgi:hypothetical protein